MLIVLIAGSKLEQQEEPQPETRSAEEDELLSKIPIMKGTKVKTIKKHSKDPLKEFANISKEIDWDKDDEQTVTTKIIKTVTTTTSDPIVKTTVTRITSEGIEDSPKSKIPVLSGSEQATPVKDEIRHLVEDLGQQGKSKIPVLKTETTIIKTTGADSDSEDDSRMACSPPLKGILKKTPPQGQNIPPVGSSSGSDIALHEEGAELSSDSGR